MSNLRERLIDPKAPERRPRRAAYALPTMFTAGNLFLGFLAIVKAFEGALLESAGIRSMVFDQNMSVLEGSLGVLPRRVLVAEEHELRARKLLEDAGLGHELRSDDDR